MAATNISSPILDSTGRLRTNYSGAAPATQPRTRTLIHTTPGMAHPICCHQCPRAPPTHGYGSSAPGASRQDTHRVQKARMHTPARTNDHLSLIKMQVSHVFDEPFATAPCHTEQSKCIHTRGQNVAPLRQCCLNIPRLSGQLVPLQMWKVPLRSPESPIM